MATPAADGAWPPPSPAMLGRRGPRRASLLGAAEDGSPTAAGHTEPPSSATVDDDIADLLDDDDDAAEADLRRLSLPVRQVPPAPTATSDEVRATSGGGAYTAASAG